MASGASLPFRPSGTTAVAASTTAAATSLAGGGSSVLVFNSANAVAFIRFGVSTTTVATTGDTPVPAGARVLLDGGSLITHASAVLTSGTGTVYFTRGDGSVY
jgi:hypothetical protein